ncbi:MAG: hypothetical protein ACRCUQ_01255 [Alphaproteobacteria bacterium]
MEHEILDRFGELLMKEARDRVARIAHSIIIGHMKSKSAQKLHDQIKDFTPEAKKSVEDFILDSVDSTLHSFLWMIEQHEEFDLVYRGENKETLVSLRDISEMLCAEPTGEGGWIERFSKYPPSVT